MHILPVYMDILHVINYKDKTKDTIRWENRYANFIFLSKKKKKKKKSRGENESVQYEFYLSQNSD